MPTREIPRNDWRTFFDVFSREHDGWLTTVEVVGDDVPGAQLEATQLPLKGISADTKGSDPDAIEITLGNEPSSELTHIVHDAARVLFEMGATHALEIESAAGDKTILQFRSMAEPELDGVQDENRTRQAGGS